MSLEDLLNNLGLTKLSLAIILIILFSVVALLYKAYQYGLFQTIAFSPHQFNHSQIIYINHKGNYNKIGPQFDKLLQETKEFKISPTFGIYYDDPNQKEDKEECRCTLGIMVNEGEIKKL